MTNHVPLPKDATLRSVVSRLDDKFAFVPAAFAVINRVQRSRAGQGHGPVVLRLGTSPLSKGKFPNYRIDDEGTGKCIEVMNGSTHKEWVGDGANDKGDWSNAWMTHAGVADLLREIRMEERLGRK